MGGDGIYHIELDLARTVAHFAIHCWDIFCINCEKIKIRYSACYLRFVASFVLTSLQLIEKTSSDDERMSAASSSQSYSFLAATVRNAFHFIIIFPVSEVCGKLNWPL